MIALALLCLLAARPPPDPMPSGGAVLLLECAGLDFGDVPRHAQRMRMVRVRSGGDRPLIDLRCSADCTCLDGRVDTRALEPGQVGLWTIALETCDYVGEVRRQAWIEESGTQQRWRIPVRYRVVPELIAEPEFIALGLLSGEGRDAEVTVRGFSDQPLHLLAVRGDDERIGALIEEPLVTSEQPGRVSVHLAPSAGSGALRTAMWIDTDSSEVPRVRVPVHAEFSAQVTCEPHEIVFASVPLGQSRAQTLRFELRGDAQVRDVRCSDDDVHIANVDRAPGLTMVTLCSTASLRLGTFRGVLRVEIVDGAVRALRLPYRGQVVEPSAGWPTALREVAGAAPGCCR